MTAVQVRRAGDVAEIVLSRPEKLNAMDMAWVTGLVDAVADLERDKPAIVVVRGEGRAFCAGLDLDMPAAEGMPAGFYDARPAEGVGGAQLLLGGERDAGQLADACDAVRADASRGQRGAVQAYARRTDS